jgi:hypothetical protein
MESIIFNYIGYVLVFCSALCLVAPVVVYLVSLIVGVVWKVVDEGDSEAPDLLKKVMPFMYIKPKIIRLNGAYSIRNSFGKFFDPSDGKFWTENYYARHDIDAVESTLQSIDGEFEIIILAYSFCFFILLGGGFIFIPTITMYLLSSALCLLSLRWSRRGYKKVKKLKVALDEHAKDKAAHK